MVIACVCSQTRITRRPYPMPSAAPGRPLLMGRAGYAPVNAVTGARMLPVLGRTTCTAGESGYPGTMRSKRVCPGQKTAFAVLLYLRVLYPLPYRNANAKDPELDLRREVPRLQVRRRCPPGRSTIPPQQHGLGTRKGRDRLYRASDPSQGVHDPEYGAVPLLAGQCSGSGHVSE